MTWWQGLLGSRASSAAPGSLNVEVQQLNVRVQELERHDALAERVRELAAEVERLNSDVIVPLQTKLDEMEGRLPAQRPIKNGAWRRLEERMTPTSAAIAFMGFFVTLLFVGVGYYKAHDPHDITEYLSYAFPIAAAILAGLSVYREDWKGRLFFGSLVFLFLGLDAFIAIHVKRNDIVLIANLSMEVLLVVGVLLAGWRSSREICRENKKAARRVRWFRVGKQFSSSLLMIALAWGLSSYAVAFYVHNRACIQANPSDGLAQCPQSIWPGLSEVWWPWPAWLSKQSGSD